MAFSVYLHEMPSLIKFTALPCICSHGISVERDHILSFTPGLLAINGVTHVYLAFSPFQKILRLMYISLWIRSQSSLTS